MTRLLFVFAFGAAVAQSAPAVSIDGAWEVHATIGGTVSDLRCTFVQKEADLTGKCGSDQDTHEVAGKVEGKTVTWQFNTVWEGQTLTVTYTGTLESVDKMKGTVDVQPLSVSGDFAATKEK